MGQTPKYIIEQAKEEKRKEKEAKRNLRRQAKNQGRKVNIRFEKLNYLIVCEGTKTEPLYFLPLLNSKYSTIIDYSEVIGAGRCTSSLVDYAKEIRIQKEKEKNLIFFRVLVAVRFIFFKNTLPYVKCLKSFISLSPKVVKI